MRPVQRRDAHGNHERGPDSECRFQQQHGYHPGQRQRSANQAATSNDNAATVVNANQNAKSKNTIGVFQIGGPTSNQAANVGGNATTNSSMTINAGSSNDTTIDQSN